MAMADRIALPSIGRLGRAGSLVLALCGGLSFASHLLNIWGRPPTQRILILVCFTPLFSLVAYPLVFQLAKRRLASFGPRARAAWLLLCFLIGGILLVVVPVERPLPATRHHLEIVATGDSNPMARASEVWILEIQRPDGSILPLDDLSLSGDWEVRDGGLVSYQNQPAAAEWGGVTTEGDFAITVVSHPWSGVMEIRLDGNHQRTDLYAESGTQMTVALPASSGAVRAAGWVLLAAVVNCADLVTLAGLVFVASVWVVTRGRAHEAPVEAPRWSWVYYALPCASAWTVWLLIFWPGLMSPDSLDQWGQMLSGSLNDWHPAFHTMTNWLITRVWLSPAAVGLAQILALSSVVGWGLTRLQRLGAPRAALWASCALFALSPVNGTMVITLWKDIPYSIAMLALTVLVLEVISSDGAWLARAKRWALLGVVSALVALYRHNGPIAAFGTVLLLMMGVYRQQWRPLLAALALAVGLWLGVRGPLYAVLHVTGSGWVALQPLNHQVAAHVAAGTQPEEPQASVAGSVRPLHDGWRDSRYSGALPADGQSGLDALKAAWESSVQVWWSLARRNPRAVLEHIAFTSTLVWRVREPLGGSLVGLQLWISADGDPTTIWPPDVASQLGLRSASVLPGLASPVAEVVLASLRPSVSWLIWRPALYLYIALAAAAVMSMRLSDWKCLATVLPILLHSAALAVVIPSDEVRFQYPVYLVGLLMVTAFLCNMAGAKRERREEPLAGRHSVCRLPGSTVDHRSSSGRSGLART